MTHYTLSESAYLALLAALGRAWHERRALRYERWLELARVLA